MTHEQPMADLAETAAALQAKVNLHIGWAMITDRPVPPELVDANAKLVEVSRVLCEAAARQASEDAPCLRPDRPALVAPLARSSESHQNSSRRIWKTLSLVGSLGALKTTSGRAIDPVAVPPSERCLVERCRCGCH
jgi:hypothetical protein